MPHTTRTMLGDDDDDENDDKDDGADNSNNDYNYSNTHLPLPPEMSARRSRHDSTRSLMMRSGCISHGGAGIL